MILVFSRANSEILVLCWARQVEKNSIFAGDWVFVQSANKISPGLIPELHIKRRPFFWWKKEKRSEFFWSVWLWQAWMKASSANFTPGKCLIIWWISFIVGHKIKGLPRTIKFPSFRRYDRQKEDRHRNQII